MALPDRNSVRNWVGMTVIGRDDTEIGAITHLLADDETGSPEWLYATVDGETVVVPLLDASEVDGRVRVVVERTAVVAGTSASGAGSRLSEVSVVVSMP